MILKLLLFSGAASAFGSRNCRNFSSDQLVQNFKLDDFLGEWFPYYRSRQSWVVTGRCPVMYFGYRRPDSPAQARRIKRYAQVRDDVDISASYKGAGGMIDNLQYYKAYFNKGTSAGSQWIGVTVNPMKIYEGNYQVVSTDYDTYAITYQCTSQTAMYDRDDIIILTRESPGYGHISEETEQKIRSEFNRLFGHELDDHELPKGTHAGQPNVSPVDVVAGKHEPTVTTQEGKGSDLLKDGQARLPLPADQQIQGENNKIVGSAPTSRTTLRWESNQRPLIFDEHLRRLDHEGCDETMYPDLSVSLAQRNKMRDERIRQSHKIEGDTRRRDYGY